MHNLCIFFLEAYVTCFEGFILSLHFTVYIYIYGGQTVENLLQPNYSPILYILSPMHFKEWEVMCMIRFYLVNTHA